MIEVVFQVKKAKEKEAKDKEAKKEKEKAKEDKKKAESKPKEGGGGKDKGGKGGKIKLPVIKLLLQPKVVRLPQKAVGKRNNIPYDFNAFDCKE